VGLVDGFGDGCKAFFFGTGAHCRPGAESQRMTRMTDKVDLLPIV
jgi:hypothetical protein